METLNKEKYMWKLDRTAITLNGIPLAVNEYRILAILEDYRGTVVAWQELISLTGMKNAANIQKNILRSLKKKFPDIPIITSRRKGLIWIEKK